jgi:hypothetical protein
MFWEVCHVVLSDSAGVHACFRVLGVVLHSMCRLSVLTAGKSSGQLVC